MPEVRDNDQSSECDQAEEDERDEEGDESQQAVVNPIGGQVDQGGSRAEDEEENVLRGVHFSFSRDVAIVEGDLASHAPSRPGSTAAAWARRATSASLLAAALSRCGRRQLPRSPEADSSGPPLFISCPRASLGRTAFLRYSTSRAQL